MKIGKFTGLIKRKGYGIWINTEDGSGVYLSTGCSIYKADGLPNTETEEQAAAILDIERKKLEKMTLRLEWGAVKSDVLGFDFTEGTVIGETTAEKLRVAATIDGKHYAALSCDDGELLFFDEIWLAPLVDVFKDDLAQITYTIRHRTDREKLPYIMVKNGFLTLAAIMPVKVLSDDYISELQDFQLMCIDQLNRENAIERAKEEEEEMENGRQTHISDMIDDSDE